MLSMGAMKNPANVQEKSMFSVDRIPSAVGEPRSVLPLKPTSFPLAT